MALLCLILAGGKGARMGQDKALVFDTVNTLARELKSRNCRVVVACGTADRASLFNEQCWLDPPEAETLAEIIWKFIKDNPEEIQLFPCDMYRLDGPAITTILAQSPGIPVDAEGQEQYTLARIPKGYKPSPALSLKHLFADVKRNQMAFLGDRLENFNHPNQIDDLNKSNQ